MANIPTPKRFSSVSEYKEFLQKIDRPTTTIAKREQEQRRLLGLPESRAPVQRTQIILGEDDKQIGVIKYRGGTFGEETEADITNTKTGATTTVRGIPEYVKQETKIPLAVKKSDTVREISQKAKTEDEQLLDKLEAARKGRASFSSEIEFRKAVALDEQKRGKGLVKGYLPSFATSLEKAIERERMFTMRLQFDII